MSDKTSEQVKKSKKIREIIIPLAVPIEWGDESITELVLRRPKAKDLEHLSSDPNFKEIMEVAQKCAQVPRRVIQDLDAEDAMEVVEAVTDFLESGHRTGRKRRF